MQPDSKPGASSHFVDVPETAWYADAVNYAYEKKLMSGTGRGVFSPGSPTSRGVIVTILWRMAGSPKPAGSAVFQDVTSDDYYSDAVQWASEQGIVGGYGNGRFGPKNPITREQLAVMIYGFAGKQGYDTSKKADWSAFADASSVSAYAVDGMGWANANGLISGMGQDKLAPRG